MDRTLNQLKKDIQEIATEHRQINSFFWGSRLNGVERDAIEYPALIATVTGGGFGELFVDRTIVIAVLDKYNEENYQQQDEVLSDLEQILHDVYVTFKQNKIEQYMDIEGDATTTPFLNQLPDLVAVQEMTLNVRIFADENHCAIPYDNYDFEN